MKKNKAVVFLVLGVVILAGIAGIFYYKSKIGGEEVNKPNPPKLFSKGDYVVEDRADGKYIVVPKVGLTAKVPATWRVEFEGNDLPDNTSQYWVNLLSPDAVMGSTIQKGCGINIVVHNNDEDGLQEIKGEILSLKNGLVIDNPNKKNYQFEAKNIGGVNAIYWKSPEKPIIGQGVGLNIPVGENTLINIGGKLLPEFKEKCLPAWEDFVKNIVIK